MTEISSTTVQTTVPTATQSTQDNATTSLSADIDTFLKLLTAQVQNQDPLEPMDSTQFVDQLATFSSLEQQIETNTLLEDMAETLTSIYTDASSEWIGRTVSAPSAVVEFDGTPVDLRINVPAAADSAALVVRSGDGTPVGRRTLDASESVHRWDGTLDGRSTPLSPGSYFVEVEYSASGTVLGVGAPEIISTVQSVEVTANGVEVVTSTGQRGDTSGFTPLD